jgi:hypothetical protein
MAHSGKRIGKNQENLTPLTELRIALSGSGGVGKSTLAKALAGHFRLPLIDEHFDSFIDRSNLSAKPLRRFGEELVAILEHKSALEDQYGGFVTDRCAIDLLHLWGFYKLDLHFAEKTNQQFFRACISRIRRYDFVVLPAWGSLPLQSVELDRAGKVSRNQNRYSQLKHHASTLGLVHMFVQKARIIELSPRLTDLDERVLRVSDLITQRQP